VSAHEVPAENFVSSLRKPMKTMEEAHAEDYSDQRRIDDQARAIEVFLADPPARCHPQTLSMLRDALRSMKKDAAHIVACWD
jgi:hypothetical protein